MATEYELKFRATPQVLAAIDRSIPGSARQLCMETTYYDTPSGGLSARRYTLRRRLENSTSVCTLKTPAGDARGEWEVECDSIQAAIPLLTAMGCPAELADFAQEGLLPICGATFTRIAKTVTLPTGTVELALDQGILTGGDNQAPLCEVEVELKTGPKTLCDAFARALAEQFSLETEDRSKFRRALDLRKGV